MQYKHLGLKMNVTKILSFEAKPWMKIFITFNIDKRIEAKNDFEIDFFKLMNNSLYEKTMENVRKRCNLTVVDNEDKALKHISQPTFIDLKMINDNFIIIRKTKNQEKLDKPLYVGVAVLDYSKYLMYNYHYGIFKIFIKIK